jgi:putative oxidoreductase
MSVAASAFDLTNGVVVLRLTCSLFFFPHIYFKIVGNPPPALGFFVQAGFKPPLFYMRLALVVESIAALGLLFDVYTQWAALLGAASLMVAAVAICFFNRSVKWLWNLGGMEFCVFWALACIALAMLVWT